MYVEKCSTSYSVFSVCSQYLIVRYVDLRIRYMWFEPTFYYCYDRDEGFFRFRVIGNMVFSEVIQFPVTCAVNAWINTTYVKFFYFVDICICLVGCGVWGVYRITVVV